MPYLRPGAGVYVTNTSGGVLAHGQPVKEGQSVGVAVKQKARSWQDGYAIQAQIDTSEPYYVLTHGVVQVPVTGITSPAVGDPVYITSANALTKTPTANFIFGRIIEIAGQRGVPTGKVRIDLDVKSETAAATF